MNAEGLLTFLNGVQAYIVAVGVGLPRVIALFAVMPVFTRLGLTGIVRTGIAMAFLLPLLPSFMASIPAGTMSYGQLAPLLLKEAMVGVTLGLVLGLPIWAAETAGEILDLQRGATFADMSDPSSTGQNNITGTLLSIVAVALYFASGGLTITLRVLYDSYNLWPLQNFLPIFSADSARLFLLLLDDIMGMGLMLVIPIVLALLLADLSLALVARAAPHMNIFILSLTVKNLTFALFMVMYGAFMMSYMRSDLATMIEAGKRLEQFAPR